jgi:hypothetical protein
MKNRVPAQKANGITAEKIITQSQVIIDHKLVHKKKVLFNVN